MDGRKSRQDYAVNIAAKRQRCDIMKNAYPVEAESDAKLHSAAKKCEMRFGYDGVIKQTD